MNDNSRQTVMMHVVSAPLNAERQEPDILLMGGPTPFILIRADIDQNDTDDVRMTVRSTGFQADELGEILIEIGTGLQQGQQIQMNGYDG